MILKFNESVLAQARDQVSGKVNAVFFKAADKLGCV